MDGGDTIQFHCSCGKKLRIGARHAGAKAKCPACGKTLVVPQPSAALAGSPLYAEAGNARLAGAALCAICQSVLHDHEPAAACPSCRAHYHADCWQENGGCAVYGCVEVAPTEKLAATEIPVSFWGQENKPCPACGQSILAAALRCRHCGATFDTARPEDRQDFQARTARKRRIPALKQTIVWLLVLSVLPCTAPFAAIAGGIWYATHKEDVRLLPAFYSGVCRLGILVGLGQALLTVLMVVLYVAFRG